MILWIALWDGPDKDKSLSLKDRVMGWMDKVWLPYRRWSFSFWCWNRSLISLDRNIASDMISPYSWSISQIFVWCCWYVQFHSIFEDVQFDGLTSPNNKITILNRYYIVYRIVVSNSEDPASSASFMKTERAGFTKALVKLCVTLSQDFIIVGLPLASMCWSM
jgi:hypothetical protein